MHTSEVVASSGTLFHYGLNVLDFPNNGSDSSEKYKAFRYYVSGFDYEDRPVVIMDWGKWDLAWLVSHPDLSDKLLRNYENYVEELVSGNFTRKLSHFLPNGYNSDQIVIIKDYDGLDVRQVYTSASVKFAMELLTKMRRCFHSVAYGFMVNSNPLTYQLIEMAKPLAGDFLAKVNPGIGNLKIIDRQMSVRIFVLS
ncbi:unnamed protein product [Allacma fusca]|uniref:Uncharacterized protein n=1 Tax=Allacma fusca TaxID=39272 RepID=A0A8J2LJJ9_9HEXA|nr:unnamed protein product [Allacma fusca]